VNFVEILISYVVTCIDWQKHSKAKCKADTWHML